MPIKTQNKKSKPTAFRFYILAFAVCLIYRPSTGSAQKTRLWQSGFRNQQTESPLFSPSAAQVFHEVASELAGEKDGNTPEIRQALVLLTAARALDSRASYVVPDMVTFACRDPNKDNRDLVYNLLAEYVAESIDLEVPKQSVSYLLEKLNSRQQREYLLKQLLEYLGGKNSALDSDLHTLLGLYAAEKTDSQTAQLHFIQALNANKYNKLAFAKLSELAAEQLEPAVRAQHLRLALDEDPFNIDSAMAFARFAEKLQLYHIAARTYEYCAELSTFLQPSAGLRADIYLPWMISCYNSPQGQARCLQIVSTVRQSGRFDLLAEALAAKAMLKIGRRHEAQQMFKSAEKKAQIHLAAPRTSGSGNKPAQPENSRYGHLGPGQLAWFYCFAYPNPDKAVDWANKAYLTDPNSPVMAAMLAYALVMNDQLDWAKQLLDNYPRNGLADLALAEIQLNQGQKDAAIELLKSVIAADPGSLEAERAEKLLAEHGGLYLPAVDADVIAIALRNSFGQTIVPKFSPPQQIIAVALSVRGDKFSYDTEFGGTVVIKNNWTRPIVISDESFFTGRIRIDASVTGDIVTEIPNLISVQIRPSSPLQPGDNLLVPVRLVTGKLRHTLLTYPQASLQIEFTVYLDPVTVGRDQVANKFAAIKPTTATVTRPGVELTNIFLQNRFNSLTKGRQGQKIKTVQLFAGLLAEQHVMANQQPLYRFMYAEWMPVLLKSALLHNLSDDDWVVNVHTMAAMLAVPLDYELINATAANLNHKHWPVRMMAMFLLTKNQGGQFEKVLDHTAKYAANRFVRDMAIALGAEPSQNN